MTLPDSIKAAYDSETFRQQAHQLVDFLADCLAESADPENKQQTINYSQPADALARLQEISGDHYFERVWDDCIRLHNPKFMGHQIMPPVPVAAMAGFFSDMMNNGMGVYEMGIAGTAIERIVIKEVCQKLGFSEEADGIMTCGGSLANLTALLAARSHCSPYKDWTEGTSEPLALMVSEQSHYCVDRAARIMGWGQEGVIKIPTDDQFRMRTEELKREFDNAKSRGITPIAVVGSACSTSTGSFDDLEGIADFCEAHQLWFHVDGAHGAANAFSSRFRNLLKGIERADSVTLDFHKMLMTPSITSALLFREGNKSYGSFSQDAKYLWSKDDSSEWFNIARRTFECTKTMLSLKFHSILATHGWQLLEDNVARLNDLASEFAKKLVAAEDFELAVDPQTNIVCYRFSDCEANERNELNARIRQGLLENGEFYIVQTVLRGETWLRSTISNPMTRTEHFDQLLDRVREVANSISSCS